ncbi:kinetochore-associated Ndc80 complex subunit ndc80 [Microbotryomycetes sp. JL221]|nr:kinetochore-associated Ndc80 complex subunit ndc80 [Microbotryomycetes sp. JL221]
MQESRRRTLASSSSSGIPVPASASRPSGSALRHSLAPSHRQSIAATNTTAAGPSLHRSARQSLAPSFGQDVTNTQLNNNKEPPMTVSRSNHMYSTIGSMSVSRAAPLKTSLVQQQQQPYAPPSERRSSTYRRSTMTQQQQQPTNMLNSTPGGLQSQTLTSFERDPRNSRSLDQRKRYAQDIVQFLTLRNYLPGADEKTLLTPTGSQFINMFKFIVNEYDSQISFDVKGKTFNDLVVPILKSIGYPFAQTITKSHLQAAGSQQSWPNMLAMLHWLVMAIENSEKAFINASELQMPAFDLAHEQGQEIVSHAWLEYARAIYPVFLQHELTDQDRANDLDQFYSRVDESRRQQRARIEALEQEATQLEEEWQQLNSTPDPVLTLQQSLKKVDNDRIKFSTYSKQVNERIESNKTQLNLAVKAREDFTKECINKSNEVEQLKKLISAQGMTPVEIQHMNSEKQQLNSELELINKKSRIVLERAYGLEIDLQKQLNSTSTTCQLYEQKATSLGLIPGPVQGFEQIDFNQEINGANDNPVPDCTSLIKPALTSLKTQTRTQMLRLNSEDVVMEEKITRINETISELKEIVETNELDLDNAERDNGDLKETVASEFATMNAELERLQTQVNHLQQTMGHSLAIAEWRCDQRSLEKLQVVEETNELKRANSAALETALDSLFSYKEHIVEQTLKLEHLADEYLNSI